MAGDDLILLAALDFIEAGGDVLGIFDLEWALLGEVVDALEVLEEVSCDDWLAAVGVAG